jgi:hypothetical protein
MAHPPRGTRCLGRPRGVDPAREASAGPGPGPGDELQADTRPGRPQPCTRPPEAARHRTPYRRRRLVSVVTSRPNAVRGRLRRPRRSQPNPGVLGQHRASPDQPGRRLPPEPGTAHGCYHSHAHGSTDPGLRRAANSGKGTPPKEIRRCLKRYLACQIYRQRGRPAPNRRDPS